MSCRGELGRVVSSCIKLNRVRSRAVKVSPVQSSCNGIGDEKVF